MPSRPSEPAEEDWRKPAGKAIAEQEKWATGPQLEGHLSSSSVQLNLLTFLRKQKLLATLHEGKDDLKTLAQLSPLQLHDTPDKSDKTDNKPDKADKPEKATKQAQKASKVTRGYKEMFDDTHAVMSLTHEGLYESGASMFWLLSGSTNANASDDTSLSFAEIDAWANLWFATKGGHADRLLAPVVFLGQVASAAKASKHQDIQLLFGHGAMQGWFLATARALEEAKGDVLVRLVEAALTVTLQLHLVDNPRKAALLQMNAASQQSSLAHLAPSFLTWLKHSLVVMSDKTATTKTCAGLEYGGKPAPKAVVECLCLAQDITGSHMKLKEMFKQAKKLSNESAVSDLASQLGMDTFKARDLLQYFAGIIRFLLGRNNLADIQDFSVAFLESHFFKVVIAKLTVVLFGAVLASMHDDKATSLQIKKIAEIYIKPMEMFNLMQSEDDPVASVLAAVASAASADNTPQVVAYCELCVQLMDCTFDADLKSLLEESSSSSLSDIGKQIMNGNGLTTALGKEVSKWVKSMERPTSVIMPVPQRTTVSRSDSGKLQMTLVEKITVSDSDSKTAANVWQQVVNKRKALCTITALPEEGAKLATKLKATFATSPIRKSFKPKIGESHLLVVVSADLVSEPLDGWSRTTDKDRMERIGVCLDFCKKEFNGKGDLLLVFDGASDVTAELGPASKKMRCTSEHGFLKYNCNDAVEDLEWENMASLPNKKKLPLMSLTDKTNWLTNKAGSKASKAATPPDWDNEHGVPCFWQESKSTSFWASVVEGTRAGAILDMTASTQLAHAALDAQVKYHGISTATVHSKWLSAYCDNAMLKVVAAEENELANEVQTHFAGRLTEQSDSEEEEGDKKTADPVEDEDGKNEAA
ncbi:unnamed protein product [Effrenium voratum]|nr:unnamed protein product [Effrenium voratum]